MEGKGEGFEGSTWQLNGSRTHTGEAGTRGVWEVRFRLEAGREENYLKMF